MSMIGFPLLLIPLAIYNIIVFLMPGVSFTDPVLKLTLMSGAEWPLTLSDMLLALAILMLLFEVIKGARPGAKYLTDHLLSLLVFGGAAAEFLLWPRFGSSTYFLLTMLALVDFLSGIALRARRGTLATPGPAVVAGRGRQASAAAPQPRSDPAPEPSVPAAAAVAESVLLDHQQPKILHSGVKPPDAAPPGVKPPDVDPPHVTAPDVKPPDVTPTHVTAADVKPPVVTPTHVTAPDVKPPVVTPTHVTAPDVKPPEVTSTHVKAPDVKPPDVTPPHGEPSAPSPEAASPDLHPGSSSPPSSDEPPPR
ncbi:MAG TPA: hypothetical protein VK635_16095 [Bradyrhizobium sp.]|jgi:hypothetical protein|nr:hypothetical protein [Bradyrhizobium sp.]